MKRIVLLAAVVLTTLFACTEAKASVNPTVSIISTQPYPDGFIVKYQIKDCNAQNLLILEFANKSYFPTAFSIKTDIMPAGDTIMTDTV